ncbi:MAG: hypothetical protein CME13_14705 [Gemmatimonadetes bacterium]|nr:hypothetical protein [Gemmatimonadota bacterium]
MAGGRPHVSRQASSLLNRVSRTLDILVEISEPFDGLFPSIINRRSHAMLTELPAAIGGQRDGDRAHLGSNLIHDEALLQTMYALDAPGYVAAADRYLDRFATHCTDTVSGLFPWGEHAYWHLVDDRPGNSYGLAGRSSLPALTHDHLRATPLWLWEKLHGIHPGCVERFAEGLDNHWVDIEPIEYIRHANIDGVERNPAGGRSCDFPRHSGFYIWDLSFAYVKTGRCDFLQQIRDFLDYWWSRRLPDGLCFTESRVPEGEMFWDHRGVTQTLSLATSLLESADLIDDAQPGLAAEMRSRAAVYTDGFFAAPHDLAKARFVLGYRPDSDNISMMTVWGSVYGKTPASYTAGLCLCHYRISQDTRLLEFAEAAGRCYLNEPFARDINVPGMDAGMGMGLLADLYDITGEDRWLEGGLRRAEEIVSLYFGDCALPSGASGIAWYESQMGPSFLLHGLARLALQALHGVDCPLGANYTGR